MSDSWLELEKTVAAVFRIFHPDAIITHDDRIRGFNSKRDRQIDVSIRKCIPGLSDIIIIVSIKDNGRPATIEKIDSLHGVMLDVRANKGVLICSGGFTTTTVEYARSLGIDLCSIETLEKRDFSKDLRLPVLYRDLELVVQWEASLKGPRGLKIELPADASEWRLSRNKIDEFCLKSEILRISEHPGFHAPDQSVRSIELKDLYLLHHGIWVNLNHISISYFIKESNLVKFIEPEDYYSIDEKVSGSNAERFTYRGDIQPDFSDFQPISNPSKLRELYPTGILEIISSSGPAELFPGWNDRSPTNDPPSI
jgi:hypothetical protein